MNVRDYMLMYFLLGRKHIINTLITEGSSMEINGATGIGKTWFTLEMICSIASGQPFKPHYLFRD